MSGQQGMYLFLSLDDVSLLRRALGTRFERVKKISAKDVRESECEGISRLRNRLDRRMSDGMGCPARIIM